MTSHKNQEENSERPPLPPPQGNVGPWAVTPVRRGRRALGASRAGEQQDTGRAGHSGGAREAGGSEHGRSRFGAQRPVGGYGDGVPVGEALCKDCLLHPAT